jgi:membrane fusion protein
VPPGEPVYAITVVTLKQQTVTAYGEQRPLSAGMRLDGDILQETRKLYEWMLEPLYSITGKM